jgi:hypothetical protein
MADPALVEPVRREAPASPVLQRIGKSPALLCLTAAVACSGAYLLILQSHLTFYADDWGFLIDRRGFSASVFLDPHNDHIALIPVAIYKALLALFGMDSAMPFAIVSTLVFLLSAVLLFVYMRRRVGDWPALLGSILILFLGASWIDLLWSFQIGFSGSIAAGLGALLALDRDDRKGDMVACALLVVATSFSELGVSFAIGALVSVALGPEPRRRRLYVPLLPVALYGVWYLGWGHTGPREASFDNLIDSPGFVFDMVAQNLASLVGLATPLSGSGTRPVGLDWGRILLVVIAVGLGWQVWRKRAPSRWLWAVLAAGGSFWFLTALNAVPLLRTPTTGRYQYPGAVFVLLIAAEALRGIRFWFLDRRVLIAATAVTVAAAVSGAIYLHKGYELRDRSTDNLRASLGALDIARDDVSPDFRVFFFPLIAKPAGDYFSAVDAFGSPGLSESQLRASDNSRRAAADHQLASTEGVRLTPTAAGAGEGRAGGRCDNVNGSASSAATVLGPGRYALRLQRLPAVAGQASLPVIAARFADHPTVNLGSVSQRTMATLSIPSDRSNLPWRLYWPLGTAVTVCAPITP